MKYFLTVQAEEDLIQIYLFGLKNFGPIQAEKYFKTFNKAFVKIANDPYMFPSASHLIDGYRYCVNGAHTIYFTVDKSVKIIRIIGKQRFP